MVMANLISTLTSWGNITFIHLFKGFFDHMMSDLTNGINYYCRQVDY